MMLVVQSSKYGSGDAYVAALKYLDTQKSKVTFTEQTLPLALNPKAGKSNFVPRW